MSRRIALLGAGWLGLPLGARLVQTGHVVHGATTRAERLDTLRAAGLTPFLVRLTPALDGDPAFFEADALVFNIPPPRHAADPVAHHTAQVAAALQAAAASSIRQVVFLSSTSVYPDRPGVVTEAAAGGADVSTTARALLAAEARVQAQPALRSIVLRLAGLIGPGRDPGRFLAGKTALPNGDAPVNLVHQADVIAAVEKVLASELDGVTVNLCADEHPLRRDYYAAQAQRLGLSPPTFLSEGGGGKVVDNARSKALLGMRYRPLDLPPG